jgi:hypothetical protein
VSHRPLAVSLIAGVLFAVASSAGGATLYVANDGVDGALCSGLHCGSKLSPCRSITCAIGNATAGNAIVVGPGRYGDLDNDGALGGPGEENGSPGCGCLVSVNKPVVVVSSKGAASTVIDALTIPTAKNVLLITNGGEFGRPAKGFTVTSTKGMDSDGIVIDSANVKVRGNQVRATAYLFSSLVPRPGIGIHAEGDAVVTGNVVTAMGVGIELIDGASATGNAVNGNSYGIAASATETRRSAGSSRGTISSTTRDAASPTTTSAASKRRTTTGAAPRAPVSTPPMTSATRESGRPRRCHSPCRPST